MLINTANLTAMFRGFNVLFNEAFKEATPLWPQVAMEVPSMGERETYGWLGSFPSMREWLGDRVIENLKAHDYTLINKDYEVTIEVDRNSVEDDRYGIYRPVISEMGRETRMHPDNLIFTLLAAGTTTLCYDGSYFFATDHPVGTGTDSNYTSGSGNAWYLLDCSRAVKPLIFQTRRNVQFTYFDNPSDEHVFKKKKFLYGADARYNVGVGLWQLAHLSTDTLDASGYAAARLAMMSVTDDNGKPLNIMPDTLVVGPSNEAAARAVLSANLISTGGTNVWFNSAKLIVSPWLT